MKKTYSPQFKAQVVLEVLKDEKTVTQLATEYGVHPKVLREWKTLALQGLPTLFERRDHAALKEQTHQQELTDLYAEIGRLTTQLSWLKKKLPS
jgi:transposase-like protein